MYLSIFKTIWFNFMYFPFSIAYKMPVLLARKVQIRHCYRGFCEFEKVKTGILRIGFLDRRLNADTYSSININGKLVLKGDGFHAFGVGTKLNIWKDGILTVGNNFTCSARNIISCSCAITIGDDNMWSYDNVVMDTDAHQIYDENGKIMNYNKPVVFGNHIWLGCRNIILKGSHIANGCMVASGSLINGKYSEDNCVITTGNKIIKRNILWKRSLAVNNQCQ